MSFFVILLTEHRFLCEKDYTAEILNLIVIFKSTYCKQLLKCTLLFGIVLKTDHDKLLLRMQCTQGL